MNLEQQISQQEQRIDDLQKMIADGDSSVSEELRIAEKELLALYREKSGTAVPENDSETDSGKVRELFTAACNRIGVDAVSAEVALGAPEKLIIQQNGSYVWHDGKTILHGLQAAIPSGMRPTPQDGSERSRLQRELEIAQREFEEARGNSLDHLGDNATVVALSNKRKRVSQLQKKIAELDAPPPSAAPAKRQLSAGEAV